MKNRGPNNRPASPRPITNCGKAGLYLACHDVARQTRRDNDAGGFSLREEPGQRNLVPSSKTTNAGAGSPAEEKQICPPHQLAKRPFSRALEEREGA